jgi:hypothetical protein
MVEIVGGSLAEGGESVGRWARDRSTLSGVERMGIGGFSDMLYF